MKNTKTKLGTSVFLVFWGLPDELASLCNFDYPVKNSFILQLQSDIFGSLNDQGLLSRASEALVAMDMKHPVSSAHQVFPQIKSDMMYSHPAISSSTAAGTSISRSSNQVRSLVSTKNEDPLVFDTLPTLKSQDCNGCTASSGNACWPLAIHYCRQASATGRETKRFRWDFHPTILVIHY